MNKLDAITSGSNYNFSDKMQRPNAPRSVFDLSHNVTMSFPVGTIGALIPISVFETVPGDKFDISLNHLLRVLPQVVPLYSNMKFYAHAFYSRTGDLWNSSQVYYTKGYNGDRVLKKPTLNATLVPDIGSSPSVINSDSILHYLYGLPIGSFYSSVSGVVSALPFMMYLRIWRDYFCNKYFYTNNRQLLPDDDTEFRLNTEGKIISDPNGTLASSLFGFNPNSMSAQGYGFLYRDYADDRYIAAMPSPQRGTPAVATGLGAVEGWKIPAQNIGSPVSPQNIIPVSRFENPDENPDNFLGYVGYKYERQAGSIVDGAYVNASFPAFHKKSTGATNSSMVFSQSGSSLFHKSQTPYHNWDSNLPPGSDVGASSFTSFLYSRYTVTLNQLRQLAVNQTELEKMARTDGSYREFGLTFFGVASKIALDYCPQYIGGTYQPILFTEVVQTSQSTNDSALGQYAGHGMSANKAHLGSITCDDYGLIMIVVSIVPDTLYSQGLHKMHTRLYQADEFLPERAKLGAQPILTQELYFTNERDKNNKLFAYQDIFDELRYMPSRVLGKLADNHNDSFFPYTQSRYFNDAPTFSQSFATTKDNVRVDFLSASSEVPFTADFSIAVRAVRPLPYIAVPANIIQRGVKNENYSL